LLLWLQHTVVHCIIGLKVLNELVVEMNQRTKKRSMTQHRKVAVSFRDHSLLQCFEIGITILSQVEPAVLVGGAQRRASA
jgi:exportin-7